MARYTAAASDSPMRCRMVYPGIWWFSGAMDLDSRAAGCDAERPGEAGIFCEAETPGRDFAAGSFSSFGASTRVGCAASARLAALARLAPV
jgi:hypothetical protein